MELTGRIIEELLADDRGYPLTLEEVIDLESGQVSPYVLQLLHDGLLRGMVITVDSIRITRYERKSECLAAAAGCTEGE